VSGRNGDRSRFHRQHRVKPHNRTSVRELWKALRQQETGARIGLKQGPSEIR
jgi:hypothetical protein